jgi:hypothetical protein
MVSSKRGFEHIHDVFIENQGKYHLLFKPGMILINK